MEKRAGNDRADVAGCRKWKYSGTLKGDDKKLLEV